MNRLRPTSCLACWLPIGILIGCFWPWQPLHAQWQLTGQVLPEAGRQLEKQLSNTKTPVAAQNQIDLWLADQHAAGFLGASLDTLQGTADSGLVRIYQGPLHLWEALDLGEVAPLALQRVGLDRWTRRHPQTNWTELEAALSDCLDWYQNKGYPFAGFERQAVSFQPQGADTLLVSTAYTFEPGAEIRMGEIQFSGNARETDAFIRALARIQPGDLYDHQRLLRLPATLDNSPYFQKTPAPTVRFRSDGTADLSLKLERRKAGKLDVLLGVLPPVDNTQRLQLTANLDILLVSPFRQGEQIEIIYNKLPGSSQETRLGAAWPFVLGTPFALSGKFHQLRRESDFLNLGYEAAVSYAFSAYLQAKFYLDQRNTRLLDSALLASGAGLQAEQLDANRRLLGAGLEYEQLDYRINPSKGISTHLSIGLGTRQIRLNPLLDSEIYTELDLDQRSQEIRFDFKAYYPLKGRHVLHLGQQTYWLGMETYFRNDQLQAGGGKSIRGFNENSFFTDFMVFFTGEYRFQLERESYLFGFVDWAYLQDQVQNQITRPLGTGLGMRYGTQAGIISITYAVGRTADIPFEPARGRIHIGFENRF